MRLEPAASGRHIPCVRRKLSLTCLLCAWFCANGVVWNVVQVVGWAKMFHDNAQVMTLSAAVEATFNGSAPCNFCHISQSAEENARQQLPHDVLGSSAEKFVLLCEVPVPAILVSFDSSWPGVADDTGLMRTEAVPVRPPRV